VKYDSEKDDTFVVLMEKRSKPIFRLSNGLSYSYIKMTLRQF